MKHLLKYMILLLLFSLSAKGNNVQVNNVAFAEQDISVGIVSIQFDISWDNSWRTSSEPNNWDAVWLFVKYKSVDGSWHHATLSQNNISTDSQATEATLSVRGDNIGAYLHRSSEGTGTFSSSGVKLSWNFQANGIDPNLGQYITELKVFAIEMVYIPQGSFYVGSGGTEYNHFYTYGSNAPYHITSEGAITVGTTNGNLYYADQLNEQDEGSIPTTFPKGYNAFYCMKYEITQEQYADFLNTLTPTQHSARFPNYFNSYRHFIKSVNGVYGCDANNNGVLNESADGQNIGCNYLDWSDGIAYSDWSGLRPMTELEYEKICRGSAPAIVNEYAWGSTSITSAGTSNSNISNSGQANEVSNVSGANCNYNNGIQGPLRVGCFSGDTRQSSGASYYGVMEMSGNLWEHCVTIGNATGRAFIGTVGDGILDANGNANMATCPGITALGSGFRGGSWYFSDYYIILRSSDRYFASYTYNYRLSDYGFRCVGGIE